MNPQSCSSYRLLSSNKAWLYYFSLASCIMRMPFIGHTLGPSQMESEKISYMGEWRDGSVGKCLPCKHDDLNLDPQPLHKSQVWQHAMANHNRGKMETGRCWTASLDEVVKSKFSERQTLSQKLRWRLAEDNSVWANTSCCISKSHF